MYTTQICLGTAVSQSKFMTMDNTLRICTWNVKGIHNPIKRKKVMSYIRKNKIGIALLQETHLDKQEHLKLKQGGYNQVFFSSFSSKSRGVAVLISKNIPLNVVKLIEDDRGRFVIINGTLFGNSISLFNIYFPPGHPSDFLIKTFADFYDLRSDYMIVAGDFNCMLNPLIDRFPHKIATPSKLAKQINGICEDLELTDVWRALHPSGKEYSFFSPPHQCYTRIDYFFMPRSSLHLAISCCINNIVISDHAMVVLELKSSSRDNFRQWRLNTNILRDKLFKPFFSTEFTSFYNINAQTTKDSSLLWETSKAYIRGLILSFSASKKRKKNETQRQLEEALKEKEGKYVKTADKTLLGEISALRCAVDSLLTQDAEYKLRFVKQKFYEHGDRPGRLLAYLTKKKSDSRSIISILDENDKLHYDCTSISSIFRNYYMNLYNTEVSSSDTTLLEDFFSKISLPTISEEQKVNLNAPISKEELLEAITKMQSGKVPGPDGIGCEFYKDWHALLLEPMLNMLNFHLTLGSFPNL